ncbi:hypothetical protein VRRI112168_00525 [Vreelandella rituensis]
MPVRIPIARRGGSLKARTPWLFVLLLFAAFSSFAQAYSPPTDPNDRESDSTDRDPSCNYLTTAAGSAGGSSKPWVVQGTSIRYVSCEIRNLNTRAKKREHFDHCEIDDMAHNDKPTDSRRFWPSDTNVENWTPRSDSSYCPPPRWNNGCTRWSPSPPKTCGTSYSQSRTCNPYCSAGGKGLSDTACEINVGPKPTPSTSRSGSTGACPKPPPGGFPGNQKTT